MSSISVSQPCSAVFGSNVIVLYCAARPDYWKSSWILKNCLNLLLRSPIEAGDAILAVYATDFDVQSKTDESPLTQADLASQRRIVAGLAELTPDIPIISEEQGLPAVRRAHASGSATG